MAACRVGAGSGLRVRVRGWGSTWGGFLAISCYPSFGRESVRVDGQSSWYFAIMRSAAIDTDVTMSLADAKE